VGRPSSGFTLLELMLVMAIILVAAALTVPAIDAMLGDGKVKAARDVVRGKWADARGRAMREGRPYKFSIIENTGKYRVEPEDATEPSDGDDDGFTYQDEGELPPGVLFTKDPNSVGTASGAGSDYEVLLVYLPTGEARADVQVLFGKEGGRPIGLQLRAITGAVTMTDQPQNNGP
jgi:prepilin-type N-terminal cleavage/methylation domain-containing protein